MPSMRLCAFCIVAQVIGCEPSRPSHLRISARAAASPSRNGSCAWGLIWRSTPVSVTMGEAQNGHSRAWMSASNSIWAPQLGQRAKRAASKSRSGSSERWAERRSSSGIAPRCSGIVSSYPQWLAEQPRSVGIVAQIRTAGRAGEAVIPRGRRAQWSGLAASADQAAGGGGGTWPSRAASSGTSPACLPAGASGRPDPARAGQAAGGRHLPQIGGAERPPGRAVLGDVPLPPGRPAAPAASRRRPAPRPGAAAGHAFGHRHAHAGAHAGRHPAAPAAGLAAALVIASAALKSV